MTVLENFTNKTHQRADMIIEILLGGYFLLGIGLSFYYGTWVIAIGVGGLNLLGYYLTKLTFKGKNYHHYYASAGLSIFMAQFIYQMHGMFEMHFTAFIAAVAVIAYQNWRTLIPLTLVIVLHHSAFAYIQYVGFTQDDPSLKAIYFTQLNYMTFETFLFHAILFALAAFLAGIYSFDLEKITKQRAIDFTRLEGAQAISLKNLHFANEIAKGNYEEVATDESQDELGRALGDMRKNLLESTNRERKDKFVNVGLAEMADITRKYNTNTEELAFQTIRYLIKYLKANQGGLFMAEEEQDRKVLKLKACYAFERKKYLQKTIEIGEGLVGQCFQESDRIYLKSVPTDYVRITSGLGDAPPTCLLLVPIKNNDVVEGVMEIALFHELEEYQIQFIEKVGENLASVINNLKINERTKVLYENSQQQSEELKSQEEEMRQNLEEISATQEEMKRKTFESDSRLHAINDSGIASIEFDLKGTILTANQSFLKLMEYSLDEVQGKHHRIFVTRAYAESDEYRIFWHDLAQGIAKPGEFQRQTKSGKTVFIYGSYSIIRDLNGLPFRVLKLATDLTELRRNNGIK